MGKLYLGPSEDSSFDDLSKILNNAKVEQTFFKGRKFVVDQDGTKKEYRLNDLINKFEHSNTTSPEALALLIQLKTVDYNTQKLKTGFFQKKSSSSSSQQLDGLIKEKNINLQKDNTCFIGYLIDRTDSANEIYDSSNFQSFIYNLENAMDVLGNLPCAVSHSAMFEIASQLSSKYPSLDENDKERIKTALDQLASKIHDSGDSDEMLLSSSHVHKYCSDYLDELTPEFKSGEISLSTFSNYYIDKSIGDETIDSESLKKILDDISQDPDCLAHLCSLLRGFSREQFSSFLTHLQEIDLDNESYVIKACLKPIEKIVVKLCRDFSLDESIIEKLIEDNKVEFESLNPIRNIFNFNDFKAIQTILKSNNLNRFDRDLIEENQGKDRFIYQEHMMKRVDSFNRADAILDDIQEHSNFNLDRDNFIYLESSREVQETFNKLDTIVKSLDEGEYRVFSTKVIGAQHQICMKIQKETDGTLTVYISNTGAGLGPSNEDFHPVVNIINKQKFQTVACIKGVPENESTFNVIKKAVMESKGNGPYEKMDAFYVQMRCLEGEIKKFDINNDPEYFSRAQVGNSCKASSFWSILKQTYGNNAIREFKNNMRLKFLLDSAYLYISNPKSRTPELIHSINENILKIRRVIKKKSKQISPNVFFEKDHKYIEDVFSDIETFISNNPVEKKRPLEFKSSHRIVIPKRVQLPKKLHNLFQSFFDMNLRGFEKSIQNYLVDQIIEDLNSLSSVQKKDILKLIDKFKERQGTLGFFTVKPRKRVLMNLVFSGLTILLLSKESGTLDQLSGEQLNSLEREFELYITELCDYKNLNIKEYLSEDPVQFLNELHTKVGDVYDLLDKRNSDS